MRLLLVLAVYGYLMLVTPFSTPSSLAANPLIIRLIAPLTALPGEVIVYFVEATFNGTNVDVLFNGVRLWYADGGRIIYQLLPQYPERFDTGQYYLKYHIPDNATGVYWIQVKASYSGFDATGEVGITIVHSGVSVQTSLNQVVNMTNDVKTLSDKLKSMDETVKSLVYEVRTLTYVIYVALAVFVLLGVFIALSPRKRS